LVFLLCLAGGKALDTAAAAESVRTQPLLNADGSGRLFVNTPPGPLSPDWSWEACKSDLSSCQPFATGGEIGTDNAPANTLFRVSMGSASGLSPLWRGNLDITAPPSVKGEIRANELVTPLLATWVGGWDGDFDQTQLAVCATPAGERCTSITEPKYVQSCRREAAVIDPAFTGKYLRVADMRFGPGTLSTLEAAISPYGHAVWRENGRTAAAIVGRIQRATGPRTTRCGPSPLIRASISVQGVASIQCGFDCRAVLIARQGADTTRSVRKVGGTLSGGGATKLGLSAKALMHLGPGRTHLIVKVNGLQAAHRTVVLRVQHVHPND
jgi:hypothetical protein